MVQDQPESTDQTINTKYSKTTASLPEYLN